MNKKYLFVFLVTFIITMLCSIFYTMYLGDHFLNYGFSLNISRGMVIYRDFGCLQMPLFFFIVSIVIKIFGNYLYTMYIVYSIITGLIMILMYKLIDKKSIIMLPLLLLRISPSYNYLCDLFVILIIYIYECHGDFKYRDLLIAFIVGITFVTKQNIGVFLLVPCLYYSKNKIKSFITFLLPFMVLVLYLFINDALLQFIDYCFLGMIDFTGNKLLNPVIIFLESIVIIYLLYMFDKSRFRDEKIAFILAFNLLIYPLIDFNHFIICFIPVFYLILKNVNTKSILLLLFVFSSCFCVLFVGPVYHPFYNHNDFMYMVGREDWRNYLESSSVLFDKYDNYENRFFLVDDAFAFKMFMNEDINKYDLMLKGNMGYHGDDKYIREIDNKCKNYDCVFFVGGICFDCIDNQFSEKIYNYVVNNYDMVESNDYFSVYVKGK